MNSPALPAASRFQNDLDDNLHQNTTTKEIRENQKNRCTLERWGGVKSIKSAREKKERTPTWIDLCFDPPRVLSWDPQMSGFGWPKCPPRKRERNPRERRWGEEMNPREREREREREGSEMNGRAIRCFEWKINVTNDAWARGVRSMWARWPRR